MGKRQNRPRHLYVLAVAAVAIAVLAVAQIGSPTSSARTSTQIVTAEKGVVQSTVSGSGNVQAGTDINVNFQTSGTLSHVYVKAGQHINKGQLLATLDSTSAQLSVDQAEQSLAAAQEQLTAAQSSSSSTTTTSLDASPASGATEFVSATTSKPTTATTTTTTTTTTKTPTTKATKPTTTTTTTPATSPTTGSSGGGGGSGSGGGSGGSGASSGSGSGGSGTSSSSGTSSAGSVATAQAAVYSAESNVTSAKTALANTKLYAPTSGTIVSLASLSPGDAVSAGSTSSASTGSSSSGSSSSGSSGTTAGSLGSSGTSSSSTSGSSASGGSPSSTSSSSSSPFAEIVNTGTMTMSVAFGESDISKIKVGQPATITLDALSGVELGAHVTAISTVGTTSNSVVSYNATLTLDQKDSRVKAGMSASASVIVGQAQGVNVPNAAITGTGSLATVTVQSNGKKTQKQVAVGLKGDSRTQIVSGLRSGDQLVVTTTLPPLSSPTSGTSSSSSGTLGGTGIRPGGGFPGAGGGSGGAGGAGRAPSGGGTTGAG